MHLTPHEQERLLIHVAADVVEKRLKRKPEQPLNYAEVVALLSAHVLEEARDGRTVAQVMASGRALLQTKRLTGGKKVKVMSGVPEMIDHLQVEATFPDGTKLVTLSRPLQDLAAADDAGDPAVVDEDGNPLPPEELDENGRPISWPGKVEFSARADDEKVRHNHEAHRSGEVSHLVVRNNDPKMRPVQVGSHYHFYEANAELEFFDPRSLQTPLPRDDEADNPAWGRRLNVPAGSSVRFEYGLHVPVQLVPLEGELKVPGLRGMTGGRKVDPAPPIPAGGSSNG